MPKNADSHVMQPRWMKECVLTTYTAFYYRPKNEKPVATRKVSGEKSYENEVEIVK